MVNVVFYRQKSLSVHSTIKRTGILGITLADRLVAPFTSSTSLQSQDGILGISTTTVTHQIDQTRLAVTVILRITERIVSALVVPITMPFAERRHEASIAADFGAGIDRGGKIVVARLVGNGRGRGESKSAE